MVAAWAAPKANAARAAARIAFFIVGCVSLSPRNAEIGECPGTKHTLSDVCYEVLGNL